jgi:hypothetical protein
LEIGRQPPHLAPPPSPAPRSARLLLTSGPLPRTNPAATAPRPEFAVLRCSSPLPPARPHGRRRRLARRCLGVVGSVILLCGNGRGASVPVWEDQRESAAAARRTHICAPRPPRVPHKGARPRLAGRRPLLSPTSSPASCRRSLTPLGR